MKLVFITTTFNINNVIILQVRLNQKNIVNNKGEV